MTRVKTLMSVTASGPLPPACSRVPSDAQRVAGGSAWVLAGRLLFGVAVVLQNAILARLLGPNDLGAFLFVQSLVLPASLTAAFGLDLVAMRELRDPRERENRTSPASFLRHGFGLSALAAAAIAAILFTGVNAACGRAGAARCVLPADLAWALWPLVALSAFQLILAAVLKALGRMGAATFLAGLLPTALLVGTTAAAAAAASAFSFSIGLQTVLGFQVFSLLASTALSIFYAVRIEGIGHGAPVRLVELGRWGPSLMLTQLLALMVSQSDVWVLGLAGMAEQVAQYGVAARLAQLVSLPHLVLGGVLPPLMAARIAEGRLEELERLIRTCVGLATVPAVLLTLLFLACGGSLMVLAFGQFYASAAPILAILAVGNVVNVVCGPCFQLLVMAGRQRMLNLITAANGALCIGLGYVAAVWFGPIGLAAVYAAGLSLQGVAGIVAARRLVGVDTFASPPPPPNRGLSLLREIRRAR